MPFIVLVPLFSICWTISEFRLWTIYVVSTKSCATNMYVGLLNFFSPLLTILNTKVPNPGPAPGDKLLYCGCNLLFKASHSTMQRYVNSSNYSFTHTMSKTCHEICFHDMLIESILRYHRWNIMKSVSLRLKFELSDIMNLLS